MIGTNSSRTQVDSGERSDKDRGYTVIELMVSLGVFSVLAIISATVMLSIFSGIRSVASQSNELAQAQNSSEWIARLVRYAAIPLGETESILGSSSDAMVLYSFSGTGERSDVPYKIRIMTVIQPDGSQDVVSDVAAGTRTTGGWAWPGDWATQEVPVGAMRRFLLEVPADSPTPMSLEIWACNTDTDCASTMRNVTPLVFESITLAEGEALQYVNLALGNTADPLNSVNQRIRLVNLQ